MAEAYRLVDSLSKIEVVEGKKVIGIAYMRCSLYKTFPAIVYPPGSGIENAADKKQ